MSSIPVNYFLSPNVQRQISNLPAPESVDIQDAIQLQHLYVPVTNNFDVLAVEQLRAIRVANGMRPYIVNLPTAAVQIAGYDTWQRQFSVPNGSWLLGFISVGGFASSAQRRVNIKDSCTGQYLFSDFVGAGVFYTGLECPLGVQLMGAPRLVGDPGTMDIEIAQITGTSNFSLYLLLMFACPVVALPERRTVDGGIDRLGGGQ